MKRVLLSVVVVSMLCCRIAVAAPQHSETAVERQEIAVRLSPAEQFLTGDSRIVFAPGTGNVSLFLSSAARITAVRCAGKPIPYTFADGVLSLELPAGTGTEPVTVEIAYRTSFDDPLPQRPGSGEDPTYGVRGAITAEGAFLDGSAGWYPVTAATPRHRIVRISAPAGIEAVTAGRRIARKTAGDVTSSVWEEEHPVEGLPLCAGPYRIDERRLGGIALYTYLYPDDAALADRYLDATARYIAFYSALLGPYPFEKFAVVENFFPTGYGFPSFTLLGGTVIRLPFIVDTSLPHEIAHSWWGNGIRPDARDGNWSEGLVTYLADYLLKERRSAAEGRDYRRQILADYATLVPPDADFPLAQFQRRTDPASRAIGYGKGAMVFHMVRSKIGDDAFFAALRDICRKRLYGTATWDDFARAFSRSTGRDLTPFFRQWLHRPGGPHLALADVTSRREGDGWRITGTVMQTGQPYDLKLPLRLLTTGQPVEVTLQVTGERTPFRIVATAKPTRLLLDPDADIFRILAPAEVPVTVNSIKGAERLLGVMTKDCRGGGDGFQRLLASLGKGDTAIIGEDELDGARKKGNDLLFCGLPQDRSLLPPLPDGITLKDGVLAVKGEPADSPDSLVFLALPSPAAPGRFVALYRPASAAAAAAFTYKITHYGPYGYLLFADGAIRKKGTEPPAAAESSVVFTSE